MTPTISLDELVQKQHLTPEAVSTYRDKFDSNPLRMIVLRNFLRQTLAEQLSDFLERQARYSKIYGVFTADTFTEALRTREQWEQAAEAERFFKYGVLQDTADSLAFSPNLLAFLKFRTALSSPIFHEYLECVTGLSIGLPPTTNTHAFSEGDFLRPHSDNVDLRSIAFVFYLSRSWSPFFGGAIQFTGSDGNVSAIEVEFNNLVLFDVTTNATHAVGEIHPAARENIRVTIGGWFPIRSENTAETKFDK